MATTAEILVSALPGAISISDGDLVLIIQGSTGVGTGTLRLMSGTELVDYVVARILQNGLPGLPTAGSGLRTGQPYLDGQIVCIA